MFRHIFIALAFVAASSAVPANLERGGKIIGGTSVPIYFRPFMASLRRSYNAHFCGGSILNNRWVLSAAHCVIDLSDDSVVVVVGTDTLDSGGTFHNSAKVIWHEDYSDVGSGNDIALIKTATTITFNSDVAPISLPTADTGGEVTAIISGWGYTSNNGPPSNELQALFVSTLAADYCPTFFGVASDIICTLPQFDKGVCYGDSGSPLTADDKVIGIASFVFGQCVLGYPDGFCRVYDHVSWIENKTSIY